jgi:hypothetical protein
MTLLKEWALFRADFPSDMIDEGEGEPIHGGKNVAEAIGKILQDLGCTVEDPEYAGAHGWGFLFRHQRKKFWIEVSEGWGHGHALRWEPPLMSSYGSELDIMLNLNERLKQDGRFHDIAWYRKNDVEDAQNGFPLPVIRNSPRAPANPRKPSFIEKLFAPGRSRARPDE